MDVAYSIHVQDNIDDNIDEMQGALWRFCSSAAYDHEGGIACDRTKHMTTNLHVGCVSMKVKIGKGGCAAYRVPCVALAHIFGRGFRPIVRQFVQLGFFITTLLCRNKDINETSKLHRRSLLPLPDPQWIHRFFIELLICNTIYSHQTYRQACIQTSDLEGLLSFKGYTCDVFRASLLLICFSYLVMPEPSRES